MSNKAKQNIATTNITTEMRECYIDYAMSVIIGRALPDVRDGLKPVHRRILYAMNELGLYPDRQFRKCVRIVGDVLGKYHPHGDASVYDALVRMAQDFTMRYPTVKGHGNFGSIDGDSPAAMRYTEAKMDSIAQEMLRDINKNTVDFNDNFDGSETEPEVLTSRFPHILTNGSQGIAVGMATNMPPHNLGEVIDATTYFIDHPKAKIDDLLKKLPGPDFPTGALLIGKEGIKEAYETGKGKIKLRAVASIEPLKRGKNQIVFSELPYMVNKAKILEKISSLVHAKRIQGIQEIRDESDLKNGIRLVIDVRKGYDPAYILNQLFKLTDLETTFGITNLVLVPDENNKLHPKILGLREILSEYIKHQEVVIRRRTEFDLNKAEKRAHILEGLLIALDHIDEIIDIIRHSRNPQSANKKLQKTFDLSEVQAQAILDMRLQRLTGMERSKIKAEYQELEKEIARLKKILSDEREVLRVIKEELNEIKKKYGDKRRTKILDNDQLDQEEIKEPERDLEITLTQKGYINSYPADKQRKEPKLEDDVIRQRFAMTNHDSLLFFTDKGRVFKLSGGEIPSKRGKGDHLSSSLKLMDQEKIVQALPIKDFSEDVTVVFGTQKGMVKKTLLKDFQSVTKHGGTAIHLKENDILVSAFLDKDVNSVIMASRSGNGIVFDLEEISPIGRNAMGVKGMTLKDDSDRVVGLDNFNKYIITLTEDGSMKAILSRNLKKQKRGGKGVRIVNYLNQELAGIYSTDQFDSKFIIETEKGYIQIDDLEVLSRTNSGEQKTSFAVSGAIFEENNTPEKAFEEKKPKKVKKKEKIETGQVSFLDKKD